MGVHYVTGFAVPSNALYGQDEDGDWFYDVVGGQRRPAHRTELAKFYEVAHAEAHVASLRERDGVNHRPAFESLRVETREE